MSNPNLPRLPLEALGREPPAGQEPRRRWITTNFHAGEFAQPARHGQPAVDYPEEWVFDRLLPLCQELEALRAELVRLYPSQRISLQVLSGYRSQAYNDAIGGQPKSLHLEGRAADIRCPGLAAAIVHAVALRMAEAGQLRIGGLGRYPAFVHVDIRPRGPGGRLARWVGSRL